MGVVADGFSVIDMTIDHVIDLMDLNSKLAVYNEYRTFLQDIASSSDLPWEMSLAAYSILQEIDNGAWGKIKDIAMDIITVMGMFDSGFKGVGFLKDNFLNIVLGETVAANFNEFLTVIKLEAWCINQIVDIGAVVREVACIVGYAQLGMHYVNKLEASKTQFLANQTADNAWDFYENYSLLYQIRHKGEEAVKELFKVDGFSSIFFDMKHKGAQDALDNIIEILEECQFTLDEKVDVPSSVKYVAKSVVSCPVNVEIYAPNGDYITTLVDGQESDISNEYGRFAVVHRVYSDEYVKVICMSQEGDYKIKVIGVDQGLINFEFAYDNNDVIEEYRFDNVEIAADSVIETSVEQVSSTQTYDMDFDGDGEIDDSGSIRTLSENSYTTVTGLLLNKSSLSMLKGESDLLTISITPNDATTQSVYWLSSNSDVAKVVDGKIIALSTGTATISCISQDNEDALATCTVTVNEPTYAVTVTNGSGSGSYAEGASVTITANVPATGKQFKEWTGADGLTFTSGSKSTATATFTMPTRAVSVTATYEDIPSTTYTITFDPNGGSITTTNATTDVTGKLSALPTPTRSRYSFNGWYTVSSGGVQVTTDTVFNSNTTIYAQWTYTGGGSGGGGGGDNTVSNTNPPSNSQTTRNSDGSTTTTTTRTVTNPDGTVTTTVTTETELMDGTTATIVTDGDGNWVSAETTVSQAALDKALADGKPIQVPITAGPVSAEHTDLAGVITLNLPGFKSDANGNGTVHVSEMPRVEIPLTESGAGIVAMLCDVDGGLTIIKECYEGSIIFPVEKSCDVIIVDNTKSFSDVAGESWYAGDVVFVAAREIFNGVGDGLFSPTSTMSRAMTAQVLYNLDRSSTAGIDSEFSDVKSSDWYADAVGWASKNAIINGYGDSFSATYAITRQDLVTILYRYAKGAGYDVSAAANLGDFIDGNSVADYAQEAMRWAINLGIIGGYEDETIRPTSSATRAEVAAIMTRFVRNAK